MDVSLLQLRLVISVDCSNIYGSHKTVVIVIDVICGSDVYTCCMTAMIFVYVG